MIQRVTQQFDFAVSARLLNEAFATVAKEFGLTKDNSPTNNAFITDEELKSQLTENREFYVYKENAQIVGFIAIEKSLSALGTYLRRRAPVHRLCKRCEFFR